MRKLCFLSLVLCLFNIVFCFSNLDFASAVSYRSSTKVQFTFNPTLSLSISSADLIIPNLAPGSADDSNEITITVNTNASYGYTLTATAGTSSTDTKLTNTNNSNFYFTSLATNDDLTTLTTDNTWGYATATYDTTNSTWNSYSNYSGLPLDNDDNGETGKVLVSTTDAVTNHNIKFKIGAKAAPTQISGEYTNVINFYAVTNAVPPTLYETIAVMSKGKQTAADLQTIITTPTSTNPAEDTSNSGVFEYDSSVFGEASDASNDYKIYYYRGILETNPGTYGSDGSANAYPNYVRLSNNTCWRIVRTTGSGGVKMIYNGVLTNFSCANQSNSAGVTSLTYATQGSSAYSGNWYANIHYIGYTYNNAVTDSTAATSVDTVFGNNDNPALNNTRSNIKTYIEDTWYANNMTSYTNMLEASAGYCNDRTAYSDGAGTTVLTTIAPRKTSNATMLFGAYTRNWNSANPPSLTCPRDIVDLYRYAEGSAGVSNELKYPVALLTVDESSFAGSGNSTAANGSTYSTKSYLNNGGFVMMSPGGRGTSNGSAGIFSLGNGFLNSLSVANSYTVRPVISLSSEIRITGGAGTATDPWTVE